MLTFESLREANTKREHIERTRLWGNCEQWTLSDWTNALAGEAGEACNITKKMSLMYPASSYRLTPEQQSVDLEEALAKEIADIVLYADLLASKINRRLPDILVAKFNEVSNRIGSEVKL